MLFIRDKRTKNSPVNIKKVLNPINDCCVNDEFSVMKIRSFRIFLQHIEISVFCKNFCGGYFEDKVYISA